MAIIKENLTVEACPGCGALDATRRCLGCRHDFRYLTVEAGEPLSNPQRFAKEIVWLREAARYFETRPTGGEDAAHWSNVFNAKNCREAADTIERLAAEIERLRGALGNATAALASISGLAQLATKAAIEDLQARAALTGEDA